MWRGVATQVRTHRTHGTQKIHRLRQDATPTDQTKGPFLLMNPSVPGMTFTIMAAYCVLGALVGVRFRYGPISEQSGYYKLGYSN